MTRSTSPDVVFVLGSWARGGTEVQALELLRGLASRGLHVVLVLVEGELPFEVPGVSCVGLGADRGWRGAITVPRAVLRLRRYLRRSRPRVVHSALARGYVVTACAIRGGRMPRVISWRRNAGSHMLGRGPVVRLVDRWCARRADVVVANSEAVMSFWRPLLGPKVDVTVVPNSIDDRFFIESDYRSAPNDLEPVLISVGALKPVKAHETLIDACAALQAQGQAVQLVLVGDGERRAELESQARTLAVPLRVTGVLDDVLPALRGASIYVHSAVSEGVSNAVLEAMAAGLPVVVPDIPGMSELIGEAGMLYSAGSATALASAVALLLDDGSRREALGRAAQTQATAYRLEAIVQMYVELYNVGDSCAA